MTQEKITVDVISDVMCPWCFIGKKRLDEALNATPEIDVEIRWRPFQLDATLPQEGKDRQTYLNDKFGGAERAAEIYGRIRSAGQEDGIAFDFDAIKVSPNTLNAHRLLRWAAQAGDGVQHRLAQRLFEMYFTQGRNLADLDVLAEAAGDAGLTGDIRKRLESDEDRDDVRAEIGQASAMGVTGVPCFVLNGQYALMGAQPAETIASALRQVASGDVTTA